MRKCYSAPRLFAPRQDTSVLTLFVVTAKNVLQSQHFISTKGDFIMYQVVLGGWPKPLAQRQTLSNDIPFEDDLLEPSLREHEG